MNVRQVELRRCEADDPAFRQCLSRYYAELAVRFEGGCDPGPEMPPGAGEFHVLASVDGMPSGCGMMRPLDAATAEIKRVWVDPAARGLGIAKQIMDAQEDAARVAGHARVVLDTNRTLKEAQAMYLRRGYAEIARYNDNPFADHWFAKAL